MRGMRQHLKLGDMNAPRSNTPIHTAAAVAVGAFALEVVLPNDLGVGPILVGPILFAIFVISVASLLWLSLSALVRRRKNA
jgi:hypothetical protein